MWHDPEDRLHKAIERFEEADVATAWRMLRGLERRGVESPRIDLYLGHCHLELGRPGAAVRRYRRAARSWSRRGEPWVGLGLAYGRLGRVRKACSSFQRAVRLSPDLEEAHCRLVHCHVLLGEMDRAIAASRRVEALDPTCPHVHRHLAIGHFAAERFVDALASWRRVEARDVDHPEAATGIGRCLLRLRRLGEARSSFQRALARDAADAGARVGLGDVAWLERRLDEAGEHYAAAAALDPDDVELRERLADVLLDAGRPAAALDVLARPVARRSDASAAAGAAPATDEREAREAAADASGGIDAEDGAPEPVDDPSGGERGALSARVTSPASGAALEARALRALGRRARGLALLRRTAAALPADAGAWRALGECLLEEDRPRAAIAPLRRARRLDAACCEATRLLARALGRSGRRKEAVAVLASATRAHPKHVELHLDVCAALLARERPDAAERALLRGLSWLPESADVWVALAELAAATGRGDDARARLRAALRRDRRHPRGLAALVARLVARGDWRRAVNAGRAASRVVLAGDVAVRDLGLSLLRSGRPREALPALRRYVLARADDPEGYVLLGEALETIGDSAGANAQRRLAQAVRGAAPDARGGSDPFPATIA